MEQLEEIGSQQGVNRPSEAGEGPGCQAVQLLLEKRCGKSVVEIRQGAQHQTDPEGIQNLQGIGQSGVPDGGAKNALVKFRQKTGLEQQHIEHQPNQSLVHHEGKGVVRQENEKATVLQDRRQQTDQTQPKPDAQGSAYVNVGKRADEAAEINNLQLIAKQTDHQTGQHHINHERSGKRQAGIIVFQMAAIKPTKSVPEKQIQIAGNAALPQRTAFLAGNHNHRTGEYKVKGDEQMVTAGWQLMQQPLKQAVENLNQKQCAQKPARHIVNVPLPQTERGEQQGTEVEGSAAHGKPVNGIVLQKLCNHTIDQVPGQIG